MLRSMFQVYVTESDKALPFYQKAFDAEIVCAYFNEDGTCAHAELSIYGQIFAIMESPAKETNPGNTMQLCLHLGEENANEVYKIYERLKDGAQPHDPIGDSGYSKTHFSLVDKFGVDWCVFA